jgi:sigma54-dependent transcription regulator
LKEMMLCNPHIREHIFSAVHNFVAEYAFNEFIMYTQYKVLINMCFKYFKTGSKVAVITIMLHYILRYLITLYHSRESYRF